MFVLNALKAKVAINSKMKNLFKYPGILALSLFIVVTLVTSACKKDKPTIAKITVVDTDGNAVKNASIRLYGQSSLPPGQTNPNAQIRYNETQISDPSGQASFDLSYLTKPGQAGFMVLDIEVKKLDQIANGIIRVEEQKTNEKTVVLQQ